MSQPESRELPIPLGFRSRVAEHFVKERGDEIRAAAVGSGAQIPQLVCIVQQLHYTILLRQRR